MRDALPQKPNFNERGVVNLDDSYNEGTHWCAYIKLGKNVYWFDSFGNIPPPHDLIKYFRGCFIFYNLEKFQTFGTSDCGKHCLEFLITY